MSIFSSMRMELVLPSSVCTIKCAPLFGVPSMIRRPPEFITVCHAALCFLIKVRATSPPMLCASRRIG